MEPESRKQILEALKKPFKPEEIEWRANSFSETTQKALAFAYIDGRALMNRLDEVLGAENWQDNYSQITGGDDKKAKRGYLCQLSLRIGPDDTWVTKMDGADESDIESIKGGLSDAFKRAGVKWGVGRYLYDLPSTWVKAEKTGFGIKLLATPSLPSWALPSGSVNKPSAQQPLPEKYTTAQVEEAKKALVPDGSPLAGKTLGEAAKDTAMGKAVITFLAGTYTSKQTGKPFEPVTPDDFKIQEAAKIVATTL